MATAAQPVKRPKFRSIEEVELSWCKFDSPTRHMSFQKIPSHAIWGSVRQATYMQN